MAGSHSNIPTRYPLRSPGGEISLPWFDMYSCWFCGEALPTHRASPRSRNAEYEAKATWLWVPMFKGVRPNLLMEALGSFPGTSAGIEWEETGFPIPRCADCQASHDTTALTLGTITPEDMKTMLLFLAVFFGLWAGLCLAWVWQLDHPVIYGAGLLVGFEAIGFILSAFAMAVKKERRRGKDGPRVADDAFEHPVCKELQKKGWRIDRKRFCEHLESEARMRTIQRNRVAPSRE